MEGSLRARLHKQTPFIVWAPLHQEKQAQHRAKFLHTLCQMQWTRFFLLSYSRHQVRTLQSTHHYSLRKSNMWTVIRRLICVFYIPLKKFPSLFSFIAQHPTGSFILVITPILSPAVRLSWAVHYLSVSAQRRTDSSSKWFHLPLLRVMPLSRH